MLTARIPEASGKAFLADQLYSYDVEITVGGHTDTLQSLGMLDSVPTPDGVAHVAPECLEWRQVIHIARSSC